MKEFIVIGYYDGGQRWSESYLAHDSDEAEAMALEDVPEINIAGVVTLTGGSNKTIQVADNG